MNVSKRYIIEDIFYNKNTRVADKQFVVKQYFDYVKNNLDENPVIIDASKLRCNPERVLKKFCKLVGSSNQGDK